MSIFNCYICHEGERSEVEFGRWLEIRMQISGHERGSLNPSIETPIVSVYACGRCARAIRSVEFRHLSTVVQRAVIESLSADLEAEIRTGFRT